MMSALVRPVTADEVRTLHVAGVVQLRSILDLGFVNDLRRCIDEAAESLFQSAAGYDLTFLTHAAEAADAAILRSQSNGQHDIAGIVDYIRQSGNPLLFDEPAKANGSFLLDTGVAARHSRFQQICTRGVIPEIAGALLESARVNFFGDQIFVKEPGTRERTAFHQDASYFEIEGDQCCVMWIPVDPVTAESGGLKYWRGSHRERHIYAPNVFVSRTPLPGSEGDLVPDIETHPENFDIVQFDVEPGDILVHHYRTVHGAGGNLSRYQVRRAASLRYCGDDIRFKTRPSAPRQLHHTTRLQDGDVLSGPDFPVVWSRSKSRDAA
jgi:hypothetical protein